jgi:Cof subfamily protein (haloacid dehalogenase superfamily)
LKPYTSTKPIALVLADVDGTLVTHDKVLTEKARDAVRRLRAKGIKFAITSGRPPLGMKTVNDDLKLDTPIAGFNGGVFVQPDWTVISSRLLGAEAAKKTVGIIQDHKLVPWLYTADAWFILDINGPRVPREAKTISMDPKVVKDFSACYEKAVKVVGVGDKDLELVAKCETDCRQALGSAVSAARSQPYYLDVTNPEATKGHVVTYLSKALNLPTEAICTLGDMPNDVLMFERTGMSIAMGNASAEVQAQANFVSTSNEDEGFAHAVDTFILPHT